MCGIVAIYSYKPDASPVDAAELLRVRERMRMRGPDGAGQWVSEDARVGLAHRRLAIIDLQPTGAQPQGLEDIGTCITFNGEIYNYRELRRILEGQGRIFRSDGDTEVLLHAYDLYGPSMVRHLRGMYAFAIWDARRQGLFLARDPFGIKPLYYSDSGKRIVAASQVKALLEADGIARDLNPAAKVSFLTLGNIVEPLTLYRGIGALPAGTTMWIDERGARPPERYWSVGDVFRRAEAQPASCPNAAERHERLRECLLESIGTHMVSDVPVGLFLSGGLDSATLLSLATEAGFRRLRTATLGFDALKGTPYDEVEAARTLAERNETVHHSRWIGASAFAEERDRLLEAMDQPSIDGVNVYFVSKVAVEAGLKVALTGLGGDEIFAGYPGFRQIPRIAACLAPFARTPWLGPGLRRLSAPLLKHLTSPKYASLIEYGTTIEDAYLLRRGLYLPWELPEILDPDEARQGWSELSLQAGLKDAIAGLKAPRTKLAVLEMAFYMRNQLLRDSDWAGMAHSLEIRLPFVDARLLEQLAPLLVGVNPPGKREMAGTPRTGLPAELLNRPKSGFTPPVRHWLMADGQTDRRHKDRGLRGWARFVLERHLGGLGHAG